MSLNVKSLNLEMLQNWETQIWEHENGMLEIVPYETVVITRAIFLLTLKLSF